MFCIYSRGLCQIIHWWYLVWYHHQISATTQSDDEITPHSSVYYLLLITTSSAVRHIYITNRHKGYLHNILDVTYQSLICMIILNMCKSSWEIWARSSCWRLGCETSYFNIYYSWHYYKRFLEAFEMFLYCIETFGGGGTPLGGGQHLDGKGVAGGETCVLLA